MSKNVNKYKFVGIMHGDVLYSAFPMCQRFFRRFASRHTARHPFKILYIVNCWKLQFQSKSLKYLNWVFFKFKFFQNMSARLSFLFRNFLTQLRHRKRNETLRTFTDWHFRFPEKTMESTRIPPKCTAPIRIRVKVWRRLKL